jgi:hypothetical protein
MVSDGVVTGASFLAKHKVVGSTPITRSSSPSNATFEDRSLPSTTTGPASLRAVDAELAQDGDPELLHFRARELAWARDAHVEARLESRGTGR